MYKVIKNNKKKIFIHMLIFILFLIVTIPLTLINKIISVTSLILLIAPSLMVYIAATNSQLKFRLIITNTSIMVNGIQGHKTAYWEDIKLIEVKGIPLLNIDKRLIIHKKDLTKIYVDKYVTDYKNTWIEIANICKECNPNISIDSSVLHKKK